MNPTAIAAFNLRKATVQRDLYPVTVEFLQSLGTSFNCAFGEVDHQGELHSSGQAWDRLRTGALYFPRQATYSPLSGQTFKITTSANDPLLVNSVWRIGRIATAAHEPVYKFICTRKES